MPISNDRIEPLFRRFLENNCTKEELEELYAQIDQVEDEYILKLMDVHYENLSMGDRVDNVDWDHMFSQITKKKVPVQKLSRFRQIAVAASIIFALVMGTYFLFFNKSGERSDIVKIDNSIRPDIKAPEISRAMITLNDGQKVYLDSAGNGSLTMQGDVNIMKLADGKIVYNGSAKEVVYNMLTNPKGSKVIDMTLADGSRLWLNAGSSVTYPVAFVGSERKVSITGEAYFEVTHNAAMPFKVSKSEMEVTVLGTHFNVKAYDDDGNISVTLLQGSVRVASPNSSKGGELTSVVIKPGQQAILVQDDQEIKVLNDVDLDEVMAWKNGFFNFDRFDIKSIMRQVARWYDVDVLYEGKPTEKTFSGIVDRNNNISEVLKIMEPAGIKFSIEEKKIIVKQ